MHFAALIMFLLQSGILQPLGEVFQRLYQNTTPLQPNERRHVAREARGRQYSTVLNFLYLLNRGIILFLASFIPSFNVRSDAQTQVNDQPPGNAAGEALQLI